VTKSFLLSIGLVLVLGSQVLALGSDGDIASPLGARSAPAPPPRLASLSVKAVAGDQQLAVSWTEAAGHARYTTLHLELFSVSGSQRTKVGAADIGHTVEPTSYRIPVGAGSVVVRATPENAMGSGPAVTSPVVRVVSSCATATICARVSSVAHPTTVRLVGQGFLHGLADGSGHLENAARVEGIGPKQWRFAGPVPNPAARTLGVSRMQILSDLWNSATAPWNAGYALTPWSNWARWQSFVRDTAREAVQQGWAPNYWDVWNEPNGTCCPRFSPLDQQTVSVDRWLRTYEIAWREIKAVDPSARIIGPSLSALQWAPGAPAEFDLETFLSYSAAHGLTWDAVSWHENSTAPSPGDMTWSVTNVDRHIAMARAVMARHPGTVVRGRIFVNEYGPKEVHALAGWTIGYLRALEDGGVNQANRACWSRAECTTQLGGLVTANGQPTALWWAHRAYARLAGAPRMRVASTTSWQLDGLATRDDPSRSVRVLLGRHWSCNKAANAWCSYSPVIKPASVSVTIDWPYGTAPVSLTAWRLPAGTGALGAMPVARSVVVRPKAGRVTITVPSVADGDGLSIVAHRA
jgi:hypothetical protein